MKSYATQINIEKNTTTHKNEHTFSVTKECLPNGPSPLLDQELGMAGERRGEERKREGRRERGRRGIPEGAHVIKKKIDQTT